MLYSIVLELTATNQATLLATTGHQAHALFLSLVREVNPELAKRLHDEPNYRPFTVSPLRGGQIQGDKLLLKAGETCYIRLTLLDGGKIWECLGEQFLGGGSLQLRLGVATFRLERVFSTPTADPIGRAGFTSWQTLASVPARSHIRLRFLSPTAFNIGDKQFALFPEPAYVWDSFMRVWNNYAPEELKLAKPQLREFVTQNVLVSDYELRTTTHRFPNYLQKGFEGLCSYRIKQTELEVARQIAALAEFGQFTGAGYKTTMGMGQVELLP